MRQSKINIIPFFPVIQSEDESEMHTFGNDDSDSRPQDTMNGDMGQGCTFRPFV